MTEEDSEVGPGEEDDKMSTGEVEALGKLRDKELMEDGSMTTIGLDTELMEFDNMVDAVE